LVLRRELDVGLAASNNVDLLLGSNAGVEKDARSRKSTSGEDEAAARLEVDDLAGRCTRLDLHTGDLGAVPDSADNLGVHLQGEVGQSLGSRHDVTKGTTTEAIADLRKASVVNKAEWWR
jgi:hypothetical protein